VEFIVQNSEVASQGKNHAILNNTTTQLQDSFATVIAAIEAQSARQTAAFKTEITKLTANLKAQLKQENEKLATSLPEILEAANTKLRDKFNDKLQDEIRGVPDRVDILKRDTAHDIDNLTDSVKV